MRQDWERLSRLIVRARVEQGLGTQEAFAKASGVSVRTIRDLEAGRRVGKRTLALAEIALGWGAGSAQEVLEGGAPTLLTAEDKVVAAAVRDVGGPAILRATPEELVRTRRYLEDTSMTSDEADQWLLDALRIRDEAEQRARRSRDVG